MRPASAADVEHWKVMYAKLERFRAQHGHCRVSPLSDSVQLARWVAQQRRRWRAGELEAWQRLRLGVLGFEPGPPPRAEAARWEQHFAALEAYKAQHGHCLALAQHAPPKGLTAWVEHQRTLAQRGRLEPGQRERLEALGFAFNAHDVAWETGFEALRTWKRQHGHVDVPARQGPLGRWCSQQRLHEKRGRLPAARKLALAALGFSWELQPGGNSEHVAFLEARDFRLHHRHWVAPPGSELETWMDEQRARWRAGRLAPRRKRELDALDFPWTEEDVAWEEGLVQLQRLFRTSGGRPPLKRSPLWHWWLEQHARAARGELAAHQVQRLEAVSALGPKVPRVKPGRQGKGDGASEAAAETRRGATRGRRGLLRGARGGA